MELQYLCPWQKVLLRLRLALEVPFPQCHYMEQENMVKELYPQKLLYGIQQGLNLAPVPELT